MAADQLIILHQYTEILLGQRKNFSDIFPDSKEKEQTASDFVRLAAKVYLGCDSLQAARSTINMPLLKRMRLEKILALIKIPTVVPLENREEYLICRIFTNHFDSEEWINNLFYKKLKEEGPSALRKNYLNAEMGKERLAHLVGIIMRNEYPLIESSEVYPFTLTNDFKEDVIKKYKLEVPCDRFYNGNLVELVHESLPIDKRDDDLYAMYSLSFGLDFGDIF